MIILNVTWRRFDQSVKQLIVGHTTTQTVHTENDSIKSALPRLLHSWYHITLLGDRGTWVWTTCQRSLRSCAQPGIKPATSWSLVQLIVGRCVISHSTDVAIVSTGELFVSDVYVWQHFTFFSCLFLSLHAACRRGWWHYVFRFSVCLCVHTCRWRHSPTGLLSTSSFVIFLFNDYFH